MKYLKLFENFDSFYESEVDFIINSLINIEDEYNLTKIEEKDPRLGHSYNLKIDENSYYYRYYDHDELIFKIDFYFKLNDNNKSKNNSAEESLEESYPGLVDYLTSFKRYTSKKLELGNEVQSYIMFFKALSWFSDDPVTFCNIKISFNIKNKDESDIDIEKKIDNYIKNSLEEKLKYKNISHRDVLDCIKSNGFIYSNIVKKLPNNNPEEPLKPVDIDNDGLISVDYKGKIYEVDLKDVKKIDID